MEAEEAKSRGEKRLCLGRILCNQNLTAEFERIIDQDKRLLGSASAGDDDGSVAQHLAQNPLVNADALNL